MTQRLRLQEIRTGKGSLSLSGWHPKALVRECGEPVVLRLRRRTGWHRSAAVRMGPYIPGWAGHLTPEESPKAASIYSSI